MIIQCTKKVLDTLNVDAAQIVSAEGFDQFPESMYGWHANIVTIQRRKVLVLINNESRFPVIINRLLKKDVANIQRLIFEAIRVALQMEGVSKAVIDQYFATAGDLVFSKTANRSMIGRLSNAIRDIEAWEEFIDKNATIQRHISPLAGAMIQRDTDNQGFYPTTRMLECLAKLNQLADVTEIMDVTLYQLHIKLDLRGHDIWRRVLIPANYSFRSLHNLIQIVFDWHDNHLHEFSVEQTNNKKLKIIMDDTPEIMEYAEFSADEIAQERFVSLATIFSQQKQVLYEYDFGDGWQHIIKLEKTIRATSQQAQLLECHGERPPENIGGLHGFNEYIATLNNPNATLDDEFMEWVASQKQRPLSKPFLNHALKHILFDYYYNENDQLLDTLKFLERLK